MESLKRLKVLAFPSLLALCGTLAANWPQWRGPAGLGVSAESGLPTTWRRPGERRMERRTSWAGIVVSNRLGRSGFRDVSSRPAAAQRRLAPGAGPR